MMILEMLPKNVLQTANSLQSLREEYY